MGAHTPHYPVFLAIESRLAIIVGSDAAAQRKVSQLLRYGADVVVIAPEPCAELRQLEADGAISLEPRGYVRGDLQGAFLVYCTEADEVARAVFSEAETLGCLINVADDPALSNYLLPSNVRRGQLQIAISTSGAAPAVAKRLRRELQKQFGREWVSYIELLGDVRALAAQSIDDPLHLAAVVAASAEIDFLERMVSGEEITPKAALAESEAAADAATAEATAQAAADEAAAAFDPDPDAELAGEPATEE